MWDPQVCSNSSLGRAILERDVPQFLAELFPAVSLWARFCNTFVAQVWRSDASVLLLLVEFPHGRNLLGRATKLLRHSLHVAMGRLALFAAREQLIDQSASLIFVQITVPGAPPATDMVIRAWEGTLPEILLLEL